MLTRVGALYHDSGKAKHPHYFVENQLDGHNIHETLDPYTSADLIIAQGGAAPHVTMLDSRERLPWAGRSARHALAEIYQLIGELAAQGKAILFVSSYLPELLGVCDKLAVMTRGVLSEIRPVSAWTPEQVMSCATAGYLRSTA